mgnify:CR=1 FL=1
MATLTLAGRLVDITTAPVEDITNLTVKAPAPDAAGAGTITTQPKKVDLSSDGSFSFRSAEGTGWLFVEGPGWSDSIRFVAKAGMTLFEQARLNAGPWSIPLPLVEGAIEEITKALSSALEKLTEIDGWSKGIIKPDIYTLDTIPDGVWTVAAPDAAGFNLPLHERGHVRSVSFGGWKYQQYVTVTKGTPVVYHRSYASGAWSKWAEFGVQENPWVKDALPNRADLNEVVIPGVYWVNSTSAFSNLVNGPTAQAAPGVLTVTATTAGNGRIYQEFVLLPDTGLGDSATFTRHRDASMTWSKWVDKSSAGASDSSDMSTGGGRGSGFKTVPVPITVGNSGVSHMDSATGSIRYVLDYAAPITRWRVCLSSRRPRQGDLSGCHARITTVAVGDQADGASYTATPQVVARDLEVPADGTVVKTPWVTRPLGDGTVNLLGIDYETINDVKPLLLPAECYILTGGDTATTVTPTSAQYSQSGAFDMWLEAETYATTPTIAGVGDSSTAGSGAARSYNGSWLPTYCREKKALPVGYAAAGDTMQHWAQTIGGYKQTRWQHLDRPDAVIVALGANDVAGGRTVDDITGDFTTLLPTFLAISPNLYVATPKPRAETTAEKTEVRDGYVNWLRDEAHQLGVRDVFLFHDAVGGDTMAAEYDSGDSQHLNDAGYQKLAEAIRPVTTPPVQYQTL